MENLQVAKRREQTLDINQQIHDPHLGSKSKKADRHIYETTVNESREATQC